MSWESRSSEYLLAWEIWATLNLGAEHLESRYKSRDSILDGVQSPHGSSANLSLISTQSEYSNSAPFLNTRFGICFAQAHSAKHFLTQAARLCSTRVDPCSHNLLLRNTSLLISGIWSSRILVLDNLKIEYISTYWLVLETPKRLIHHGK